MKQRESVYNAVNQVMNHEDGEACRPTKEQRAEIIGIVVASIMNGETDFSDSAKAKYDTEEKVTTYVGGLVSNWLRKDERLNGGVDYQPKNPGSRTGSRDEQIKALRALKSTRTNDEEKAMIQNEIDKRLAALAIEKAKKVEIDMSVLPQELVAKLGLAS